MLSFLLGAAACAQASNDTYEVAPTQLQVSSREQAEDLQEIVEALKVVAPGRVQAAMYEVDREDCHVTLHALANGEEESGDACLSVLRHDGVDPANVRGSLDHLRKLYPDLMATQDDRFWLLEFLGFGVPPSTSEDEDDDADADMPTR